MPSYLFHLKFELYSSPTASPTKRRKLLHAPSHSVFVPRPGSDVFKLILPAHKVKKWEQYNLAWLPDRSKASTIKRPETPNHPSTGADSNHSDSPTRPPTTEYTNETHGDTLLLPERTLNRKDAPRSPALNPAKPSNETAAQDWRYDTVSLESIDMELQGAQSAKNKSGGDEAQPKPGQSSGLHTKAIYLPSDPKTTELGWGVVRLFRDSEESSVSQGDDPYLNSADHSRGVGRAGEPSSVDECSTLCILAVPSWMMPSDLLGFVGDQAREDVSHFRLIRTGRANKYMVLMKFRSTRKAREWQKAYNGRLFSVAEPENCHVVFIKSVEFISPDSTDAEVGEAAGSFPRNDQHDPFTDRKIANSDASARPTSTGLNSKPFAPPPPNLLELPTCPVCLERMDETTGLLTILCQHVFHCACLEKWRFPGSGCPVCRYTQSPSYTFPYPRPQGAGGGDGDDNDSSEPLCSVCASHANLWICLICGSIGCGRYDSAHAFAHYEATSHCYAMDLNTQRVWDYAGDGYVHRLIQSKPFAASAEANASKTLGGIAPSDAASADRPSGRHENEAFRAEGGDLVPREKMECMANEYTYLLTSQLEGQRRYFEEQVERAADKASEASTRAEEAVQRAQKAGAEAEQDRLERERMSIALERVERACEKNERMKAKFERMARDLTAQLREEKSMNEGLVERVKAAEGTTEGARKEVEEMKREKMELQEMNNDLTVFISSQEKVKELQAQGEDVVDGSVSLPPEQKQSGKKGKGRKR